MGRLSERSRPKAVPLAVERGDKRTRVKNGLRSCRSKYGLSRRIEDWSRKKVAALCIPRRRHSFWTCGSSVGLKGLHIVLRPSPSHGKAGSAFEQVFLRLRAASQRPHVT